MTGQLAVYAGLGAALLAGLLFLLHALRKGDFLLRARQVFWLHGAAVAVAAVYLSYALLTGKFHYAYVYTHTDSALPTHLLLSAFWAGQEGSLLFWALSGAVVGWWLLRRETGRDARNAAAAMTVVALTQAFLMLLLVLESPFRHLGWTPAEGTGLNPLLVNPWMVIHPPLVFIGYALLLVPCASALAVLWRPDRHEGLWRALPWTAAGWLFLGAGIVAGGVWAYGVLGWGGYWTWDPVENASLLPWLSAGALLHGMLLQRRRPHLIRTNVVLAVTTYLLVILATFITRSGVLADFSVHAFAGGALTRYLAAFMLLLGLAGYGLYLFRRRELPVGGPETLFGRATAFRLTIMLFCGTAAVVLLGTLSPVVTGWFGAPQAVDQSYYWRVTAPLALLICCALAVCPFLGWERETADAFVKRLALPVPAAVAVVLLVFLFFRPVSLLEPVLVGAGVLVLLTNGPALIRALRRRPARAGGYLAHTGVVLALLGILASQVHTQNETLTLYRGDQPATAFGYSFIWTDLRPDHGREEGYVFTVNISSASFRAEAELGMYTAGRMLLREPHIVRNPWRDVYVSPLEYGGGAVEQFTLAKMERHVHGDYTILFREFSVNPHAAEGAIEVAAVLEVSWRGQTQTVFPVLRRQGDDVRVSGALLPGGREIYLDGVNASHGLARLALVDDTEQYLVIEVSRKPLIAVLAFGAALTLAGTGLAAWRRFVESPGREGHRPPP